MAQLIIKFQKDKDPEEISRRLSQPKAKDELNPECLSYVSGHESKKGNHPRDQK